ncbi:alanine racemase [Synergistales bacterium]|nr:alanine racemase [Synergistales bacterium]
MTYPILHINTKQIRKNAEAIRDACASAGIDCTAVVKGYNALSEITSALYDAGYRSFASSRLPHLRAVKSCFEVETMAIRIPMLSETDNLVDCADVSLNSEIETIKRIDEEARSRNKTHKIILMRDLGDLREGIIDEERFMETAVFIENNLRNIHLRGIGSNLSCYGSITPTAENLSVLVSNAREVERAIGRKLDVVSGGASTSLYLSVTGEMPEGINHLRVGAANLLRSEARDIPEGSLEGLTDDAFIFEAEIVEIGEKPTRPTGRLGLNAFGNVRTYEDRGIRRRAILAAGAFDIADYTKLIPIDEGVTLLGCSSDHLIADIHDSKERYRLGGTISMTMTYQSVLFATANNLAEKRFIE